MSFLTKVGSLTVPSVTGSFAVTGVGFQPKLVLFFGNRRTADGTSSQAGGNTDMEFTVLGVGISSSAHAVLANDDNFTSGNPHILANNCIELMGAGSAHIRATFTSQDSDGFTINFTLVGITGGQIINYIALGGTDLQVALKTFTTPGVTGNQSQTGVGFQPDAMILFGGVVAGTDSDAGLGLIASTTKRAAISSCFQGVSGIGRYSRNDKAFVAVSGTIKLQEADLVSFDSDGFTLNYTISTALTQSMFAVCLKGVSFQVLSILQKTSTGSQAYTGAGFSPQAILFASVEKTVSTTVDTTLLAWMIGGVDSSLNQAVNSLSDNNRGVAGLSRSFAMRALADDATPTVNAAGAVTSLDSDGFTVNWSTADATAREFHSFLIGPAAGTQTIPNVSGRSHSATRRRKGPAGPRNFRRQAIYVGPATSPPTTLEVQAVPADVTFSAVATASEQANPTPATTNFSSVATAAEQANPTSATTNFSAISTAAEQANPNSATVNFSAVGTIGPTIFSPAARTDFSALATTAEAANPNAATANFSALTTAAEIANPNSATTNFSGGSDRVALQPSPNSALTTFSALSTAAEAASPNSGTTTFNSVVTVSEQAKPNAALTTFSGISTVAVQPSPNSALVTFSALSTAAEIANPNSARVDFSAGASGSFPIAIFSVAARADFSAVATAARLLTTPSGSSTYSGLSTLTEIVNPPSARTDFSSSQISIVRVVNSVPASVLFSGGVETLQEFLQAVPGTTTFSGPTGIRVITGSGDVTGTVIARVFQSTSVEGFIIQAADVYGTVFKSSDVTITIKDS